LAVSRRDSHERSVSILPLAPGVLVSASRISSAVWFHLSIELIGVAPVLRQGLAADGAATTTRRRAKLAAGLAAEIAPQKRVAGAAEETMAPDGKQVMRAVDVVAETMEMEEVRAAAAAIETPRWEAAGIPVSVVWAMPSVAA
jgi:hypothetical protein